MTPFRTLLCAFALNSSVPSAKAALHFDQLTACSDLERLYNSLQSTPTLCRQPENQIEHQIYNQFPTGFGIRLCILPDPPSQGTAGFTCIVSIYTQNKNSLTCYRPANLSDIESYKSSYAEQYAGIVARYLTRAGQCPVGNGNAAAAPTSELPPLIAAVAKFEFGFIMGIGKALFSRAAIIHGYASVDPALGYSNLGLEFINIFHGNEQ